MSEVKMPSKLDLMWPTVKALKDLGGSGTNSEILTRIIDNEGLGKACASLASSVDTLNPNARLLEIRVARAVWEASGKKADLAKLEGLCRRLAALGYREMPAQMYLNWLFELRTAKNPLDSVRYRPKRFPKPDSLNGLPVLTLTDGYFDEFPDWADSTRMAGVVFDLKKKKIAGIVHEPDSIRRGESWTPSRWLSTDPIHHPYQSPYAAFDGNPIFFVDPNGTTVGEWFTISGIYKGNDGRPDDNLYIVSESTTKDASQLRDEYENGLCCQINNDSKSRTMDQWNEISSHAEKTYTGPNGSINFTSRTGLTASMVNDEAHWIYGEGGGSQANEFAHIMINRESMINQHVSFLRGSQIRWQVYNTDNNNPFLAENTKLGTFYQSIKIGYTGANWEDILHRGAPATDQGKINLKL